MYGNNPRAVRHSRPRSERGIAVYDKQLNKCGKNLFLPAQTLRFENRVLTFELPKRFWVGRLFDFGTEPESARLFKMGDS